MSDSVLQYLDELIANCEKRLKEAEQKVLEVQAELNGYRRVREEIEQRLETKSVSSRRIENRRDFSENWKRILRFIYDRGLTSITDIEGFVMQQEFDIQRGAIRAQLHLYTRRHILVRIDVAQYQLTAEGKALVEQFE